MNDPKPQPWHPADEKPKAARGNAPLGTHSLTGSGSTVGMPPRTEDAERSTPPAPEGQQPDPLAEPRANTPGVLGPKR
ncbi:MAG TPA: hypothetical protein VEB23_06820 [Ramlibacter sp.]|nr:hypothetical protein [Ramlibacter sp.]